MKKCGRCLQRKPYTEFYKCSARGDGLRAYCKKCELKINKSPKMRAAVRIASKKSREKYLYKWQAREKLHLAIDRGEIIKPTICDIARLKGAETCSGRIEAHHFRGYEGEHWKDVKWLCKWHHRLADIGELKV